MFLCLITHNMTYTHKNEKYDIVIDYGNIVLQGLNRDFFIEHGASDLEAECIEACSQEFVEHDGSTSIDYDRGMVNSLMDDWLPEYIARHIETAEVIEHNNN